MRTSWFSPVGPEDNNGDEPPLVKKLLWFFGIALVSAVVVMSAAYVLRGALFL
ncbi:MAG: hypothetical protein AAFS13_07190 [Pseudomonadota bacterium]